MKKALIVICALIGMFMFTGCEKVGKYRQGTYFGYDSYESYGTNYVTTAVVYIGDDGMIKSVYIDSTYNKDGVANAMNAAWGGQWDMKEIMISLGSHATTDNLAVNDEFTVAFATKDTLVSSDLVGIVSAKNDPKKIEKTGWNIVKAEKVNAPVFTNFPMTLECRVSQKIDESETGYYLVAEIVNILVDENFLAEDGNPDIEKMQLITFDPVHHGYIQLGHKVGQAFSDGKALKS